MDAANIAERRSRIGFLMNPKPGEVNNEAVLFWGELTGFQAYVCDIDIEGRRIIPIGVLYGSGKMPADDEIYYRFSRAVLDTHILSSRIERHAKKLGYDGFTVDTSSLMQFQTYSL